MSSSTMVAHSNPSIHIVSPDSRKTSVVYQPIPENKATTVTSASTTPRFASAKPTKFDYFNPSGNRHVPEILQERAALERIAHAFSKRRDD
ncbi:hypothetical protein C8R42DRAFT_719839 [Lentinula raphanica]|nr:hypothetical protein C8R42DRAFT_719839 [Lentinula raphanica]